MRAAVLDLFQFRDRIHSTDCYARWLVKERGQTEGLSARNITPEGFGEEKPVVPNINPDGNDNPPKAARKTGERVQITVEK